MALQKCMSQVDDFVEIKMLGFSESFNISVASSIITEAKK